MGVLRYDVLFMTEPLDELTVQAIAEYDGKALTDLGKENVDLGGDDSDKAKKDEQSSETAGEPFVEVCGILRAHAHPHSPLTQGSGHDAGMYRCLL